MTFIREHDFMTWMAADSSFDLDFGPQSTSTPYVTPKMPWVPVEIGRSRNSSSLPDCGDSSGPSVQRSSQAGLQFGLLGLLESESRAAHSLSSK